ncbi:baseplate J/gp47 family protein [Brevibacillus fulvus]|uniref:Phage protein gp47/JayE n=1 Tax=Brevibacillus fulvus TaxID=1125967 RepID=A0A939BT56_9BACL|nr:baseplate J/gp47 family protein [Brevibacillus fulvus]MBM7591183.1 putative phage protein gp47/JayE [Brevibacillus fulvus]
MADAVWKPRFEEEEARIRDRVVGTIPAKWRKAPGDFTYDMATLLPPEIKALQINQDYSLKNAFALFAEGEYLDYICEEANVYRSQPDVSKGILRITAQAGVEIPMGYELTSIVLDKDKNPVRVTVDAQATFTTDSTLDVAVTSVDTGADKNVPAGSEWILNPPIPGVEKIEQLANLAGGRDLEDDESLRAKWKEKKQKPIRSGNKQNYVSWALEVTGVGKAKCVPLWNGEGTVKVIIIDTEGLPATPALVAAVQNYIDPDQTGEGNGAAPIGAIVTVESAVVKNITVTADVTPNKNNTVDQVLQQFNADLDKYLAGLTFVEGPDGYVIYSKVAGLLSNNPYLADYTGLTVNGGTANVTLEINEIPVRGTVTFT